MLPLVIWAPDQPGWCFENIANQVAPRLSSLYRYQIKPALQLTKGDTDIAVSMWWGHALHINSNLRCRSLIPCVYDALSWRLGGGSKEQFSLVLKHATCLAVANQAIADEIREVYGKDAPRIFVTEDGVDTRLFWKMPLPGTHSIGWTGNSGRSTPEGPPDQKGLGLIKEAHRLYLKAEGIHLRILDAKDGGGWPLSKMPSFYYDVGIYVCASFAEGTPNPLLEALACGRPVVSTRVGLAEDIIQDGKNGYLVERDPKAIAEAVQKIYSLSPAELQAMSKAARESVMRRSWADAAIAWRNCLDYAASQASPEPVSPAVEPVPELAAFQYKDPDLPPPPSPTSPVAPDPLPEPAIPSADRPKQAPAKTRPGGAARRKAKRLVTGRPSVLCLADQPGWAFENGHRDMAKYLNSRFSFTIHMIYRWPAEPLPDLDQFDIIFIPYTNWRMDHLFPYDRCLGALRSQWFPMRQWDRPGPTEWATVNAFQGFQVVTRKNYDELHPYCPGVRWLPNPVNLDRFPLVEKPRDVIAQWNGNAGRLAPNGKSVKGFHEILRPACEAAGVRLNYAEYTERRLKPEQMPEFYEGSNLFVHSSFYEGCCKALLESMAARHAVVSTEVGQVGEMHREQLEKYGESGIILLPRDLEAYTETIQELKQDPERVLHMGELNRRCVTEGWSWSVWADRYADFLEMALEASS